MRNRDTPTPSPVSIFVYALVPRPHARKREEQRSGAGHHDNVVEGSNAAEDLSVWTLAIDILMSSFHSLKGSFPSNRDTLSVSSIRLHNTNRRNEQAS